MLYSKKTDYLDESIRLGREMDRARTQSYCRVRVYLHAGSHFLTVMMFFIDASMVGHLEAEASASIGLIRAHYGL